MRVDEERDKHERRIMRDVPRHQVVQAFDHRLGVGIERIAVDMAYQHNLQRTRYDERGWRATFYTTGMEHSPMSATGTEWERTSWRATQRAAWEALKRMLEKC